MKCDSSTRSPRRQFESGFGAATAAIILSFGALALSVAAGGAASVYADQVSKNAERVQSALYSRACSDSVQLIKDKDILAHGKVEIPELRCVADI